MQKKKKNQDTDLKCFSKINSKWTIGLNVKYKAIKVWEDNTAESLDDIGHGDDFSDTTLKAEATQRRNWEVGIDEN